MNFTRDVSLYLWTKSTLLNFGNRPLLEQDQEIFCKIFQQCKIAHFGSGNKWSYYYEILPKCVVYCWTRKSQLNFESPLDPGCKGLISPSALVLTGM